MIPKSILLKALLLSLLLHIAVFEIFGFSLSPRPETPKPSLMFLGSLLHSYDMETMRYFPSFPQKPFTIKDKTNIGMNAAPLEDKENLNQKLSYSSLAAKKNKAILKNVGLSLKEEETQEPYTEEPEGQESKHKYLTLPNADHY